MIRTSIITGLPGEGEQEFEELCNFLKEHKLERVGAFAFSPEDGTPAAMMTHVDETTAQERAEMVETIQSRMMDDYNQALIGKTLDVLIDGFDDEFGQYYGRTYADSPEIDGKVWVSSEEALRDGMFVRVVIDSLLDGELNGFDLED